MLARRTVLTRKADGTPAPAVKRCRFSGPDTTRYAHATGGVALWAGLFAIAGIAFLAWGLLTARRLSRLYGSPGVPPTGAPFSPVPYVDRQGSMWREGGGGVGSSGEAGTDIPAP